ncbi:MAG: ROK family protein [Actinomycetota bacterium]|nr:ROK family protein [Actinomycetota bacterium]
MSPDGLDLSTSAAGTDAARAPNPAADLTRVFVRMAWRAEPTIELRYAEDVDVLAARIIALPPVRNRYAHDLLTVRLDGTDEHAMPVEIRLEKFAAGGQKSAAAVLARQLLGSTAWRRAVVLTVDGEGEATVELADPERDELVAAWERFARPVRVVGVQVLPGVLHGVLVDDQGSTLEVDELPIEGSSPDDVATGVAELTRTLWDREPHRDCMRAVGVQIGGPMGAEDGVVHHYRKGELTEDEQWRDDNLGGRVERVLGHPVVVLNDVSALAVFERWHGVGQRFRRYGLILVSEGIGGALVTDGALCLESPMEIGMTVIDLNGRKCRCGGTGCVEASASVWAMVNRVKKDTDHDVDGLADAVRLAETDQLVRRVFREAGEDLAAGIGSVQALLELKALAIYLPPELNDDGVAAREFWSGVGQYARWVSFERSRHCELERRTSDVEGPRGAAFAALERFGFSSARVAHGLEGGQAARHALIR